MSFLSLFLHTHKARMQEAPTADQPAASLCKPNENVAQIM